MRTLVIIPAFNEEESLLNTISSLKGTVPDVDYVVVNDGSTDNTKGLCEDNDINVINLPVNIGLAGGFQAGMKYALLHDYDAALQFDADGQHKPEYILPMIQAMEEADAQIVIGSRFITKKKHFSSRMIGSSLISGLIRLTSKKSIKDPTSGMRLYNRQMIRLFATGHDIEPEPDTLAYCLRKGAKVCEVAVEMQERVAGKSYLNVPRAISYMFKTCISILILQWFR